MGSARETDETLLHMVNLRSKGARVKDIAAYFGATAQYVSTATMRVKRDDEKHTGKDLTANYWPEYRSG